MAIELATSFADPSLEMTGTGDRFRVAQALQNQVVANSTAVNAHKARHQDGGADEIDVTGLSGKLADAQTPLVHAASHAPGGADAIATGTPAALVPGNAASAGATALLANSAHVHALPGFGSAAGTFCQGNDARLITPANHASRHLPGGADALFSSAFVAGDLPFYTGSSFNPTLLGGKIVLFGGVAVSSTTYATITAFDMALPRAGTFVCYGFEYQILYTTDNVSEGIGLQLLYSGTGNIAYTIDCFTAPNARAPLQTVFSSGANVAPQASGPGAGVVVQAFIRGALQASAVGTLSLQARAKTATIPVTIATLSTVFVFPVS